MSFQTINRKNLFLSLGPVLLVGILVALMIFSVNRIQNREALDMRSRADTSNMQNNAVPIITPILPARNTFSVRPLTEEEMRTFNPEGIIFDSSDDSCPTESVRTFVGWGNQYVCRKSDKCDQGETCSCSLQATIICLKSSPPKRYEFSGECKSESSWADMAKAVCCKSEADNYLQGAGFGFGDKEICDAICQTSRGLNCVPDLSNPDRPVWVCPNVNEP